MAMGQYFQEAVALANSNEGDGASLKKCKSVSATVDEFEHNPAASFDCNICLDYVHDPVVTLCGHLYCWPCIYKWIHYQSMSAENLDHQQPQCPVCKAVVSQETLVPLYGRGIATKPSEAKPPHLGLTIPQRPSTPRCGINTLTTTPYSTGTRPAPQQLNYRSYQQHPQPYYPLPSTYGTTPMLRLSGTTATSPMIGVFGEMVYARLFGNSQTTVYTYPNSYHLTGNNSPRFRRHVMEADKSLGRVCFFLCCCMVLCLLLF